MSYQIKIMDSSGNIDSGTEMQRSLPRRKKRTAWTPAQDERLKKLAIENHEKNWRSVAEQLENKFPNVHFNAKKCRSRWNTSLHPDLRKGSLTEVEGVLVLAHHHQLKNDWVKIASNFSNRHSNLLRNCFYGILRKIFHDIMAHRTPSVGFSPFYFIQSVYLVYLIIKLLKMSKIEAGKNEIVPSYMTLFVKQSKVTEKECQEYFQMIIEKLSLLYSSNMVIKVMVKEGFSLISFSFIQRMSTEIISATTNVDMLSIESVINIIEKTYLGKAQTGDVSFQTRKKKEPQRIEFPLIPEQERRQIDDAKDKVALSSAIENEEDIPQCPPPPMISRFMPVIMCVPRSCSVGNCFLPGPLLQPHYPSLSPYISIIPPPKPDINNPK
eukprot:TRINITY_DN12870_c0_g1_i3.p1 TRINITY_DN12870_c0_g1~~TRINITY_DN12870_c0_g1_i3.p1  ORF type:complete len:382 (-),score=28.20 TRINITY_DN12870_c0_g1_i3:217-1362(-)